MYGRAVAALAALALSSCSYAFVRPPPADYPAADDCTDSRVPPVLDTAFSGLLALTLLIVVPKCLRMTGNNEDGTPADGCTGEQWLGLGWTAVVGTGTAISAVHGYRATSRCSELRALEPPIARVQ